MTRDAIRAQLTDEQALACLLLGEAGGEPIEGLVAVANVVCNRARHPRWWGGPTVKSVVLAPSQFSCWWETNANAAGVYAMAEALVTRQPLGDRSLVSELRWIAQGALGDQLRDHTRSADHYLTRTLFESSLCPSWAKGRVPVAAIASHVFLRLEL